MPAFHSKFERFCVQRKNEEETIVYLNNFSLAMRVESATFGELSHSLVDLFLFYIFRNVSLLFLKFLLKS